jgi:hypothetical protein
VIETLVVAGHLIPVGFIWWLRRTPRFPGEFFTYEKLRAPQVVEGPVTLSSDYRGLV